MRRHQDHIKIRKNWLPPTVRGEVDESASPEPQAISLEEMLEDVTLFFQRNLEQPINRSPKVISSDSLIKVLLHIGRSIRREIVGLWIDIKQQY